jgi:hypothetical protein
MLSWGKGAREHPAMNHRPDYQKPPHEQRIHRF